MNKQNNVVQRMQQELQLYYLIDESSVPGDINTW